MSPCNSRYDDLVAALHEGELGDAEAAELAALARALPELRRDLRRELVLWELWSQHQVPERSAESFLAACRTRLRAESEAGERSFLAALSERLTPPARPATARRWWRGSLAFAWAAPLATGIVAMVIWLALPRTAHATSLRGEAVCAACTLHVSDEHRPVLRIHDGGSTRLYHLESDHPLNREIGDFCTCPVPIDATGSLRTENGRLILAVRALARLQAPGAAHAEPEPQPTLFPF